MLNNLSKDTQLKLKILVAVLIFYAFLIFFGILLQIPQKCKTVVNLQPVSGVAQPLNGAENK
jgi:hypothetical protein